MFRKTTVALAATAIVAATALAPTAASAKWWNHHHHHHHGIGAAIVLGSTLLASQASDCYLVKRVYWKNFIKHVRYVEVCD
jgi:hypothetical protein